MFWNRFKRSISINNTNYWVDDEVYRKIVDLQNENEELREKNERLESENVKLIAIKPVLETKGFKPAVSDKCKGCNFAYFSEYWDDEVIGCIKDVVCPGYSPKGTC